MLDRRRRRRRLRAQRRCSTTARRGPLRRTRARRPRDRRRGGACGSRSAPGAGHAAGGSRVPRADGGPDDDRRRRRRPPAGARRARTIYRRAAATSASSGEAGDGAEAVERRRRARARRRPHGPVDARLDGVEATRGCCAAVPGRVVVVLTSFAEADRGSPRRSRPAPSATCSRTASPRDLLAAVRAAAAGHAPLDPRVARALLPVGRRRRARPTPQRARARGARASSRRAWRTSRSARALGISERTVKAHLGNVFRQIGVGDRTSARSGPATTGSAESARGRRPEPRERALRPCTAARRSAPSKGDSPVVHMARTVRSTLGALVLGAVALAGCTTSDPDEQGAGVSAMAGTETQRTGSVGPPDGIRRRQLQGHRARGRRRVRARGQLCAVAVDDEPAVCRDDRPHRSREAVRDDRLQRAGHAAPRHRDQPRRRPRHLRGPDLHPDAREATARLGHDVKRLGTDRAVLDGYLRSLQD